MKPGRFAERTVGWFLTKIVVQDNSVQSGPAKVGLRVNNVKERYAGAICLTQTITTTNNKFIWEVMSNRKLIMG